MAHPTTSKTIHEMTAEIRQVNIDKGWRPATGGPGANSWGDYLALLHSEISEALEAYRTWRLRDATAAGDPLIVEGRDLAAGRPPKPEGVGSEFADIVIRLLDMYDVFGIKEFDADVELAGIAVLPDGDAPVAEEASFGDWMAWLHGQVVQSPSMVMLLRAVVTAADRFGIDLEAEYERKMAYNRTRPYQHGGRTLTDAHS